jgi:peptide/nickel transport system permease protein
VRVVLASTWIALVILAAIFAPLLPISNPDNNIGHGLLTPLFHTGAQPLGTDEFGRSVLARLIYGGRVSLAAAAASVIIAMAVGLLVGISAGYWRGKLDTVAGILLDSILAFPPIIVLLALAAVLQPSLRTIIIGLSLVAFPPFARLARVATLQRVNREFVLAARGLGARPRTILFRELLPAVITPALTYATVITPVLILAEASISFLGLGVAPPTPSWGNMIAEGYPFLQTHPQLVFVPAVFLFLTIFAFTVLGEWLRSRSDIETKL